MLLELLLGIIDPEGCCDNPVDGWFDVDAAADACPLDDAGELGMGEFDDGMECACDTEGKACCENGDVELELEVGVVGGLFFFPGLADRIPPVVPFELEPEFDVPLPFPDFCFCCCCCCTCWRHFARRFLNQT